MASPNATRALVIGIGTDDRSDDGVGLDVVRTLRRGGGVPADLCEGPGELTRLLDVWEGRERVVLVDAMRSDRAPGTIQRWGPDDARPHLGAATFSSHGISLANVLELAHRLGRLPPRVTVYGIEAGSTVAGRSRSGAVQAAVPEVARRIAEELGDPGGAAEDA